MQQDHARDPKLQLPTILTRLKLPTQNAPTTQVPVNLDRQGSFLATNRNAKQKQIQRTPIERGSHKAVKPCLIAVIDRRRSNAVHGQ